MANSVCPHCGKDLGKGVYMHRRMCLSDPTVQGRLRAFLHETASDGYILPGADYKELSGEARLPNYDAVQGHFGSWGNVAEWAGLQYRKGRRKGRKPVRRRSALDGPVARIGREPGRVAEYRQFEGMPARPGVLVRAAWDIGAKRYVPAVVETGWVRLW